MPSEEGGRDILIPNERLRVAQGKPVPVPVPVPVPGSRHVAAEGRPFHGNQLGIKSERPLGIGNGDGDESAVSLTQPDTHDP